MMQEYANSQKSAKAIDRVEPICALFSVYCPLIERTYTQAERGNAD